MGFLCARREHLHRRFVGVDNMLPEHHVTQCVDKRLQLHTAHANPLSQG
ncbi:hypothetical protein V466_25560 [Pseudomonas mandelii PD30]|uniref:Uncharacterized protein n=1 Tax=Pseudomonas mandelii PD30 TaxID=1419583 RepID=A0A059KVT8_9PSED|nr:hypothetical protein V466_25560 [Pseudomonas mandelii PD30]